MKLGLYLLLCVAAGSFQFWIGPISEIPTLILICFGFFWLCAAVLAAEIVFPPRVICNSTGFRQTGSLLKRARAHTSWQDITGFFVWKTDNNSFVGYNYTPEASPHSVVNSINERLGAQAIVNVIPAGSMESFAEKLNDYRHRALALAAPETPDAPANKT